MIPLTDNRNFTRVTEGVAVTFRGVISRTFARHAFALTFFTCPARGIWPKVKLLKFFHESKSSM